MLSEGRSHDEIAAFSPPHPLGSVEELAPARLLRLKDCHLGGGTHHVKSANRELVDRLRAASVLGHAAGGRGTPNASSAVLSPQVGAIVESWGQARLAGLGPQLRGRHDRELFCGAAQLKRARRCEPRASAARSWDGRSADVRLPVLRVAGVIRTVPIRRHPAAELRVPRSKSYIRTIRQTSLARADPRRQTGSSRFCHVNKVQGLPAGKAQNLGVPASGGGGCLGHGCRTSATTTV